MLEHKLNPSPLDSFCEFLMSFLDFFFPQYIISNSILPFTLDVYTQLILRRDALGEIFTDPNVFSLHSFIYEKYTIVKVYFPICSPGSHSYLLEWK